MVIGTNPTDCRKGAFALRQKPSDSVSLRYRDRTPAAVPYAGTDGLVSGASLGRGFSNIGKGVDRNLDRGAEVTQWPDCSRAGAGGRQKRSHEVCSDSLALARVVVAGLQRVLGLTVVLYGRHIVDSSVVSFLYFATHCVLRRVAAPVPSAQGPRRGAASTAHPARALHRPAASRAATAAYAIARHRRRRRRCRCCCSLSAAPARTARALCSSPVAAAARSAAATTKTRRPRHRHRRCRRPPCDSAHGTSSPLPPCSCDVRVCCVAAAR